MQIYNINLIGLYTSFSKINTYIVHTSHKGWSHIYTRCTDTRNRDQNLIGPIFGP